MIYFDEETQKRIWAASPPTLAPGGCLYIGHSERISASGMPFELVGADDLSAAREARP